MNLEAALASLAEPAPATLAARVAAATQGDELFSVEGPAGPLWAAAGPNGVSLVHAGTQDEALAAFAARYPGRPLRHAPATPQPLAAALTGNPAAARTLRYDLSSCSPFQRAVLVKAAEIPRGEVRSYGWIASEIGVPAAVRAVGTALGRNPVPVLIPCHRVVRSDGRIGNYALGPGVKQRILATEGVDLERLTALADQGVRYLGSATTRIFCVPTCHAARRIQPGNEVPFRNERQAGAAGYRPCKHCRPAAAAPSSTT